MTLQITISSLLVNATDLSTFNLYSNVTGLTTNPFATDVTLAQLQAGYTTNAAPNGTTTVRVQATGACDTFVDKQVAELETITFNAVAVTNVNFRIIASFNLGFYIYWGDGSYDYFQPGIYYQDTLKHDYSTSFTGEVKIASADLSQISTVYDSSDAAPGEAFVGTSMSVTTQELSKLDGCIQLGMLRITTTGDVVNLPRSLTRCIIWANNTVSGNVKDLPPLLTDVSILGNNTLTGDVKDIPRAGNLSAGYYLAINGNNTISGNVKDLPSSSSYIDNNYLELGGWNTVTGDINDIPKTWARVYIDGKKGSSNVVNPTAGNTLFGDIGNIPLNAKEFHIWGNNIISGNINGLNAYAATIEYINIAGLNTINGTIQTLTCNKLSGINIYGFNEISGSITGLRADSNFNILRSLQITGRNTISGDISGVPLSMVYFLIVAVGSPGGVITGSISSLAPLNNLIAFGAVGNSYSISGDIADFPSKVSEVFIEQSGGPITTYTPGHVWPNPMGYFSIVTTVAFSTSTTDAMLADINIPASNWKIITVDGSPKIRLKTAGPTGGNSNPNVVSLATKVGGIGNITFIP